MEQGKKCAEWNRKSKKEVPAAEEVSKQVDSPKLNYWLLGGGAVVIMGLYFTNGETQETQIVQPQQAKPEPTYDPFVMD